MIRVEQLSKRFGEVKALDGISFEVGRGEVVGLLGPNGAGKTTTMRIITGSIPPCEGSVAVDGICVKSDPIAARRRIGYLPENAPLYTDMEVIEHLDFAARLRGMDAPAIRQATDEVVELCGLGKAVGRRIGGLSRGFRQRVGLAAALMHRPDILILDEPTSGLDPNQIAEIRALISDIGRRRTVVLSTHIMQEVEAVCSRAIIISGGRIVGQGTLDELMGSPAGGSEYVIAARADRERIAAELAALACVSFKGWLCGPSDERQRLALTSVDGSDRAEEIFCWAAERGIALSELARTGNSLEQVFRDLTG